LGVGAGVGVGLGVGVGVGTGPDVTVNAIDFETAFPAEFHALTTET
jgi:hypothetical protein